MIAVPLYITRNILIKICLLLAVLLPITSESADAPAVNLALGKPVTSSGPTWSGLFTSSVTDGNPSTFVHPLAASGTLGYFFEIDLGQSYQLDHILIRNRNDGCCPERLSNYGVEIYADGGGVTGQLNWSTLVRTNKSNSGNGGIDTLVASNSPSGFFSGRFLRIVNRNNAGYAPQIAEVEVYGALLPQVLSFTAERDTLATGESTELHWQINHATGAFLGSAGSFQSIDPTQGQLTLHPSASTLYQLIATNSIGSVTSSLPIGVNVTLSPPEISEFMASNSGAPKDEDGDASDWIELRNPNLYSMSLAGYRLTDDPTLQQSWVLPSVRVAPGGFLILFASGKNRNDPAGELHTNFKLDSKGDYLALIDPDQHTVIQQFPKDFPVTRLFPKQKDNVSYGVDPLGHVGFFRPATPGRANRESFEGVVSDTHFSIDRGFYTTNLLVELSSSTEGAVIRYTLNKSEPSETNGVIYSGPISITNTAVLRAMASRSKWAPTDIDTHTYVFPSNVIQSPLMSPSITKHSTYGPQLYDALREVPSVSLVTAQAINDTTEVPGSFEWINPDGTPGAHAGCGARFYGGAFTDFPKKSFRLYFRSKYGAGKFSYPVFEGHDHGVMPVEEFDELELRNCSHDMSQRGFYMSNICTDDTLLEMGRLNPHGRFVHLYLNGSYWGLYHLRERWGASMHSRYLGGTSDDYESINGNWNVGGWADPGVPYDGDGSLWEKVKTLRKDYVGVRNYLDVPEFVDYMLMWMFGGSEDEYRCVGPKEGGSGLKFYLNDADGWFCIPTYCAADNRTARSTPGRLPGDGPGSLFSMLYAGGHPDYRMLLADQIYAALFNNGPLTQQRTTARLMERCNQIQRAFIAESARWQNLTPSEWAARRDQARNDWLSLRTAQCLTDWRAAGFYPKLDAPSLNQQGGVVGEGFLVQFTGPTNGTVYYTTNGLDPRLPGGGIAPFAQSYVLRGIAETLVSTGSVWRWFTDGSGLSSSDVVDGATTWSTNDWKHPSYDDSSWNQGAAQLGYGEGDEATVLPSGSGTNQWISSYFRRTFTVTNNAELIGLTVRLKRDDGALIYFNGKLAARSSMPNGIIRSNTPGLVATDDGQKFNLITLTPGLLREGTNVIAVEFHQTAVNVDASFDLELTVVRARPGGGTVPAIFNNLALKCRSLESTQWSALNAAFFQVGLAAVRPGEVVLNELNYHPPGSDRTEFLELLNVADHAINLRGSRFTNGLQFNFASNRDTVLAPGQRLVLVNDLLNFQRRYGSPENLGGVFFGSLDNNGEAITLVDAAGTVLFHTRYNNTPPWPQEADGLGYSLVLAHPAVDGTNASAWRLSATPYGSPGRSDSTPFSGDPLLDLDSDGLPALLEYALGSDPNDAQSGKGIIRATVDASGLSAVWFSRSLGADDVTLRVDYSYDLEEWRPATLLSTKLASAGQALESWGAPTGEVPRLFYRVSVW